MATIIITEFMDEAAVHRLAAKHRVVYQPDLVDRLDDLRDALAEADALIVRNRTEVNAGLLDAAPKLCCVGRLGVGLDNIDLDACERLGVTVYPASGANDVAVIEYVIGAALVMVRGAFQASERVASGEWPRQALSGGELQGKHLGLVGFGSIARGVARCASVLGMRLSAYDPYLATDDPAWSMGVSRQASLMDLLSQADLVSLHVPLTEGTHRLIAEAELQAMKPGSMLINTARGGVVDEAALAEALTNGHLAAAAIDVFEAEPLPGGSVLAGVPGLLLTPHIAGVTRESNQRVSAVTADHVIKHLETLTHG